MAMPQPGAFSLGTRQHFHLEFKRLTDEQSLFDAIRCVRDNADTVAGVNVVVGFGPQLLADLFPRDVPKGFESFRPIAGTDGFMIPGGQHDLWIWLHGSGQDVVLDTARSVARELDGVADLVTEQQSFAYGSSQDLTGFEDGTENLSLDDALSSATVSGSGPAAGGSVVLLQRWVHDLAAFNALDVDERERVIGRTLADSTELNESQQPTNSHVSRVVIEDEEGDERRLQRRHRSPTTHAQAHGRGRRRCPRPTHQVLKPTKQWLVLHPTRGPHSSTLTRDAYAFGDHTTGDTDTIEW